MRDLHSCDECAKFWTRVEKTNECWLWTGKLTGGYGRFRRVSAHRWILAHVGNYNPPRLDSCHSCHNRACVRPSHLQWGSRSENMLAASAIGSFKNRKKRKTHCLRGHEYDKTYSDGERACSQCCAIRKRKQKVLDPRRAEVVHKSEDGTVTSVNHPFPPRRADAGMTEEEWVKDAEQYLKDRLSGNFDVVIRTPARDEARREHRDTPDGYHFEHKDGGCVCTHDEARPFGPFGDPDCYWCVESITHHPDVCGTEKPTPRDEARACTCVAPYRVNGVLGHDPGCLRRDEARRAPEGLCCEWFSQPWHPNTVKDCPRRAAPPSDKGGA